MHEGQGAVLPCWHQRSQGRVEAEITVKIEHRALTDTRDRDRRAILVVAGLIIWHYHVQSVDRTAEELLPAARAYRTRSSFGRPMRAARIQLRRKRQSQGRVGIGAAIFEKS